MSLPVRHPFFHSRPLCAARRFGSAAKARGAATPAKLATGLLAVAAVAAGLLVHVPASGASTTAASASSVNYTVTRTADADSFSATTAPRYHFGKRTYLDSGTYGRDVQRGFLHFTLPTTGHLVSAQLVLSKGGKWSAGTLATAVTTTRWSESSLNHANAPRSVKWLGGTPMKAGAGTVTVNVTSAFRAHRATTIAVQMVGKRMTQFASRQAKHGKPTLRVVMSTKVANSNPSGGTPTSNCSVSAKLVPSCGRWWGLAPNGFNPLPLNSTLATEDQIAQRRTDIVHVYHVNDQLFPTASEKAEALEPGYPKLLLINWKPATDMSWAAVANGGADARIDRLAEHINQTFPYRFFLTIYHEPEDNVRPTAGSGFTATDYAAMYRHVVLRLRADGVDNAVTVMNYMGYDKWAEQSWFDELWPGSDVVDWIGLDPYGTGTPGGYGATDFKMLVDRPEKGFPGYYTWATKEHPGKPIMLCEWGVQYNAKYPTGQASMFDSMQTQLADYPQVKSLVYYDVPVPPAGDTTLTTVTLNSVAEESYRRMARALDSPAAKAAYAS